MASMSRRDFLAAESALQRAVSHDPARAATYETLASVYAQTGRKAQAERMTALAQRLSRHGA